MIQPRRCLPFLWVLETWISDFCALSIVSVENYSLGKQHPSSFADNKAIEPYRALARYLDTVIPTLIEKRSI